MNIQAFNSTPTMSSIEMVEFINSQRKECEAELRHDNFMAKVPKVLGEEDALILKGIYRLLGVTWNKQHQRWQSKIMANKMRHHVGYFDTPEEAHAAYMAAKSRLHIGGRSH